MQIVVIVQGQSPLLEPALAITAASGLAGLLDGRQEQGDEDGENGDRDEQLDQRKAVFLFESHRHSKLHVEEGRPCPSGESSLFQQCKEASQPGPSIRSTRSRERRPLVHYGTWNLPE